MIGEGEERRGILACHSLVCPAYDDINHMHGYDIDEAVLRSLRPCSAALCFALLGDAWYAFVMLRFAFAALCRAMCCCVINCFAML